MIVQITKLKPQWSKEMKNIGKLSIKFAWIMVILFAFFILQTCGQVENQEGVTVNGQMTTPTQTERTEK